MRNRLSFSVLTGAIAFLIVVPVSAQAPKFNFDTGDPAWGGERIQLPPGFAPDMKWKGEEDIRFAPGMMKAEADDFFTYVLVFLLEKDSDVSTEAIKGEILTYYQGLSKAVMKGKGATVDAGKFTIEMKKAPKVTLSAPGIKESEVTEYSGTLDWVEPFATQKPQKLHFEVQLWRHGEKPTLFLCVSPHERDTEIWEGLRKIRSTFRIEDS